MVDGWGAATINHRPSTVSELMVHGRWLGGGDHQPSPIDHPGFIRSLH
jgi:hypothetical protein